jgi:site-specific recombinase XerD
MLSTAFRTVIMRTPTAPPMLSSDEVCALLGLSASNQRVLLHRGRSRLRGLLELYYASGQPVMGT